MSGAAMLLLLVVNSLGASEAPDGLDWPRWRGPRDSGSAEGAGYPVHWTADNGLAWKVELPGKGSSTPIVARDRILLTAPVQGQDAVLAFDLAGHPVWQRALGPERPGKHRNGSGCNPSAVTDGQVVAAYFKSGTVAVMDLGGRVLWKVNLQERFGKDTLYWDIGSSPVMTERDVLVAVMHEGGSYLVAFDKQTGNLHWKADRNYQTPLEDDHSYTTPIGIRHAGREAVLVWGALHLTAHDAADGKVFWSCGDFNPDAKKNWVAVSSPLVAYGQALGQGMVVVPFGRGASLHGIRLGGSGDVTRTHRAWRRDDVGSFVPTPAEYRGRVYVLGDRGAVDRIDPATGTTNWRGVLPKSSSKYYASPLVAGGRLYAAREDGRVYVVGLDAEFKVLAEIDMHERLIASPVPLDGRLLLRGEKHLFCVERIGPGQPLNLRRSVATAGSRTGAPPGCRAGTPRASDGPRR
jgi:outer membrane protein assembly factor BamB